MALNYRNNLINKGFISGTVGASSSGAGPYNNHNGRGAVGSAYTTRSDSIDNATTASVPPAISVVTFRWDTINRDSSGAPDR